MRAAAKWHREQRNAFEAEAEMHRQRYENTNRPDSLTAEAEHHRRLWETASAMAANHLDYAAGFEEMARAALAQPSPAQGVQENSGYDQLWAWFGLSRSAYAVLPRVMMHAMPDDWQRRFAELMDKWDDHWPNQPDITAHVQIKQNNRFISTPPWLLNYRHPDHNQLNAMRGKDEL